jgi:hypothetical protein
MKFGIFYELQLPRPWGPDDERKLYQNALDQVELADKLGYDYAWEVEHHFLEEYSHSPAPEVFLGAASQRTKNIRLGHGIVQLTTNPPQRVAERIACLDLVSNGRVEMGTGESASITELGGFSRDMETKREIWEDALRCIIPMFQDKGVELDTKWHKMPMRNVLPKPVQKPHPPLWVACSQLETIEMAGRRGLGARGRCDVLPVRVALLRLEFRSEAPRSLHGQHVGRIQQVEAREPRGGGTRDFRRTDRLTGDAASQAAAVRDLEHRPGDSAEPGGQELARAHMRKPGTVRERGDAGVPRQGACAPGVEAQGADARDRTRGDRYHALSRAVRSEHGADTGAAGG